MAYGKVIFTKDGRFHWVNTDMEMALSLKTSDLEHEWFIAELFYPDFPDYEISLHSKQIKSLLSKPDELVRLEITDQLRALIKF